MSRKAYLTQPRLGRQALCLCNSLVRARCWCPSSHSAILGGRALCVSCKQQSAVALAQRPGIQGSTILSTCCNTDANRLVQEHEWKKAVTQPLPSVPGLGSCSDSVQSDTPFCCCPLDTLQHWAACVYGCIVLAAVWLEGVKQQRVTCTALIASDKCEAQ